MKVYPPDKIRNVVLVGHSGAGKTTLAEALLYRAGVVDRLGRVEDGSTVMDFDPEEHKRGISLAMSYAPAEWHDHKINIIDTPGYADFIGDLYGAMRVADLAVFVVSAVEGVEVGTERAWRLAERLELPRMIFINKLDKERSSYQRTLEGLQERFGAGIAPLELPIGEEAGFHGVADLLTDRAYFYDSGKGVEGDIPPEMEEIEHRIHDDLIEGIVVADDELLEGYLEGVVPSFERLEETMAIGVADATVFPVVCGSATGPIAVDRLANFIVEIGPSPAPRNTFTVVAGGQEMEIDGTPEGEPLLFVFKTVADPYVGQISIFKVLTRARSSPTPCSTTQRAAPTSASTRSATSSGRSPSSSTPCPPVTSGRCPSCTTPQPATRSAQGEAGEGRWHRAPGPGARHRHRGGQPGRRGQAGHLPAPPPGGGPRSGDHPIGRDPPDAPPRHG